MNFVTSNLIHGWPQQKAFSNTKYIREYENPLTSNWLATWLTRWRAFVSCTMSSATLFTFTPERGEEAGALNRVRIVGKNASSITSWFALKKQFFHGPYKSIIHRNNSNESGLPPISSIWIPWLSLTFLGQFPWPHSSNWASIAYKSERSEEKICTYKHRVLQKFE